MPIWLLFNQQHQPEILVCINIYFLFILIITKTQIKVIAVGTGQAMANAQNCDGNILIVHDKKGKVNLWKIIMDLRFIS